MVVNIGVMAEWLRRQTRNLVGSAHVGSNPADVDFFFIERNLLFGHLNVKAIFHFYYFLGL